MMNYTYDYRPKSNKPQYDVGFAITSLIIHIVKSQRPEYLIYFPYQGTFVFEYYFEGTVGLFKLTSRQGVGTPTVGEIKDENLIFKVREIVASNHFPNFDDIFKRFPDFFSFESFIYIGTQNDMSFSWRHFEEYIVSYLNKCVFPEVMDLNKKRVLDVIPPPPSYNINKIQNNIFIIETPSVASQGTCFFLNKWGFITCSHCIEDDSVIYKANNLGVRYPIKIIKRNETIDLAIFSVDGLETGSGLEIGDSDSIVLNDHVAVAGFPNHNYGDSGIFAPGLIVGFRVISSIRRFLINTPLIGGNSGGPIISGDNKVVGVAVTGADKMQNASLTEDHGVIPISALQII